MNNNLNEKQNFPLNLTIVTRTFIKFRKGTFKGDPNTRSPTFQIIVFSMILYHKIEIEMANGLAIAFFWF